MLILTFVYMSALIFVKCNGIGKSPKSNEAQLKVELLKSLRHVSHFLAAVEKKIKNERRMLKHMDYRDFHYGQPDKRKELMDYDVTDISWWNERPANVPRHQLHSYNYNMEKNSTTPHNDTDRTKNMYEGVTPNVKETLDQWVQDETGLPKGKSKNTLSPPPYVTPILNEGYEDLNPILKEIVNKWIRNISDTKLKTYVRGQQVTPIKSAKSVGLPIRYYLKYNEETKDPFGMDFEYGGIKVGGYDVFTTIEPEIEGHTESATVPIPTNAFVEELKQMLSTRHGYCNVFAIKFLELVKTMDDTQLQTLFTALKGYVNFMNKEKMLECLGEPLTATLIYTTETVAALPGEEVRNRADHLRTELIDIQDVADEDIKHVLVTINEMFNPDEGEQLFAALEHLANFSIDHPKDMNKPALIVVEEIMSALLAPFSRTAGTKEHGQFVKAFNKLLSTLLLLRRMQVNTDFKIPAAELTGRSQLLLNTTERITPRTASHLQNNFRRRMKHKKPRRHKKKTKHRKYHRYNHRKMRKIVHNISLFLGRSGKNAFKKKKNNNLNDNHATHTPVTLGYVNMLRATYGKPNKIVATDTITKSFFAVTIKQHRQPVRQDNPISLTLKRFRSFGKNTTKFDRKPSKLINRKIPTRFNYSSRKPVFTRTTKSRGVLQKILEASSYSDEENDLKVNLYRAFDVVQ